jgi:hypothetical protein
VTHTKYKQAIEARVKDKAKAQMLFSFLEMCLDHHRSFTWNWKAKNRSEENRASFSVRQILDSFGLPDERGHRILIAKIKRELENVGVLRWFKPWTPEMGKTRTNLADELEPLDPDLPPPEKWTEHSLPRHRLCDVVGRAINNVSGGVLDPGVARFLAERELGFA